jgi:hypothetical protein
MRTKLSRVFVAGAIAVAGLVAVSGERIVQAAINNDVPFQQQSELDEATTSWNAGGWGAMDGGIGARPFIKDLSVVLFTDDFAVDSNVLDNPSNDPNPTRIDGTNVDATVTAINLCREGQEPVQGQCYETPNRVQINFGWRDGGQGTGDLGADGSIPSIDADSEIRVTIGLNTLGQSLRWSYLEGTPTYWKVNNIGQEDATIELHFKPALKPWPGACSQIPVNPTCETTSADTQYLMGSLLLSLDDTLDPIFTGALFAGEGIFIGSLEAASPSQTETGGQVPQMSYGIAAPRMIGGARINSPTFQAFLSDQAILNYFGATPDVAASSGFFNTAFSVGATAAGTGANAPTIEATRWVGEANGTDGWLITISDIALSTVTTPDVSANRLQPLAQAVRNPRFTVKNKNRAPTISASRTGVVVTGIPRGCTNNRNCRIVVSRINSKTGSRFTDLGIATLVPSGGSLRASVSFPRIAGTTAPRLSIMVQRKVNNRWNTYVTSVVRRAR